MIGFYLLAPLSNCNASVKFGLEGARWEDWDTVVYWFAHGGENLSSILSYLVLNMKMTVNGMERSEMRSCAIFGLACNSTI